MTLSVKASTSKPKVRIRIKQPSALTKFGYHLNEPASIRHKALLKAAQVYGYTDTIRKLNPLVVWHKRRGIDYRRIAKNDEVYLRKLHDESKV